ncbi:MAG: formylglycine-generating enzyme family protein, partial [Myxococcota bacterium]
PLRGVRLAPGSYLLELRAPGRLPTRYPIQLRRQEHWDGIRPGERSPYTIELPPLGALAEEECYVPAGWFWCGEEQQTFDELPQQRVWVDAFVIKRFPVSNREYLHYLNSLRSAGRLEELLRTQPRQRSGPSGQEGPPIYGTREDGTREDGTFCLVRDAEGDLWHPEWPVVLVNWYGAHAYSLWKAEMSGLPWRLPGELEYEKAGRGVDGRHFPWGDFGEPTCFVNLDTFQGKAVPAEISDIRSDLSPYEVTGLAGNSRSWCLDVYQPTGPRLLHQLYAPELQDAQQLVPRCVRGGSFMLRAPNGRVAGRSWGSASNRSAIVGLRLARPYLPTHKR